jgi:hypothetical protein
MKGKPLEMSLLFDFYGETLTEKQRELFDLYYNEDLSLSEIAEHAGITRQGVRDSIKRGEGIILELEEKVGFAKRYRAVQQGIAQLESLAREIQFENANGYTPSKRIDDSARKMLEIIGQISE